jgi:hypothetical protein
LDSEGVELLGVIGDEVAPSPAAPLPQRLVDVDGQGRVPLVTEH